MIPPYIGPTIGPNVKIELGNSNDFKLYKKWYGINHKCKKLINKSIYAITEFSRNNSRVFS